METMGDYVRDLLCSKGQKENLSKRQAVRSWVKEFERNLLSIVH